MSTIKAINVQNPSSAIVNMVTDSSGNATFNGAVTVTKAASGAISALTYAATTTIDLSTANNFSITLTGNVTFANPSNPTAGQSGSIFITQDATGSRTASWGANWDWPGGIAPTLTTTANSVDRIDYVVRTTTSIQAVFTANYS